MTAVSQFTTETKTPSRQELACRYLGTCLFNTTCFRNCLQATTIAMQHLRHKLPEVAATVAQQLVGVGRIAAAADLQESMNDVQGERVGGLQERYEKLNMLSRNQLTTCNSHLMVTSCVPTQLCQQICQQICQADGLPLTNP